MKRKHSEVKPCWPLFRKKCEACGRMFRWERGVKWHLKDELAKRAHPRLDGVDESTCYLCKRCAPPAWQHHFDGLTPDGMAIRIGRIRKRIEKSRPPAHFNCRCDTIIADDVDEPSKPRGITAREAARNFARVTELWPRMKDIRVPRRSTEEKLK